MRLSKSQIPEVIREIETIRQHATEEEKARLNWEDFHPSSDENCIYGLMTGHCDSVRARQLARMSGNEKSIHPAGWSYQVSPMEIFIHDHEELNFEIIQYIKGEINELPDLAQFVE